MQNCRITAALQQVAEGKGLPNLDDMRAADILEAANEAEKLSTAFYDAFVVLVRAAVKRGAADYAERRAAAMAAGGYTSREGADYADD